MLHHNLNRFWRRRGQIIGVIAGLMFGMTTFGIAGCIQTEEITWAQAGIQIAGCAVGILTSYIGYKKAKQLKEDGRGNHSGTYSQDVCAPTGVDAARIR